jgi:hypothetical protein
MVASIDILDTAVKIGLGALISGITAYYLAKLNHHRDIEKAHIARRRELLEVIAKQIESFTKAAMMYWARTTERAEYERRDIQIPEEQLSSWREAYSNLASAFTELTDAEAILLLLGEEESQRLIRAFGDYVKEFRQGSYVGGNKLAIATASFYKEKREGILAKRQSLFRSLSAVYKQ